MSEDRSLHKYRVQGVDTSSFKRPKEGDRKIISGVTYVWTRNHNKLQLVREANRVRTR